MSSLSLLNSSGVMPFLTLTAVFLFIGPVLFMGIATIWSNIKQKVSDELYARAIEIVDYLDTPEIEKTFTEFDDKLTAKVDTSISKFKSIFIAEINKIYAEIDGKLTAEAEKNKARDDDFTREAQEILNDITTKVNNIEEACRNEFRRINVVIENLQNETNQDYAIVQRFNFDQQSVSNESEANSTNESETNSRDSSTNSPPSSSSGSSNLSGIFDITGDIKIRFKEHFDRLMKARNYTFDEMCFSVAMDIRSLGGNIKISTVKTFYSGVSGSKVSTINQINAWVASFNNNAE